MEARSPLVSPAWWASALPAHGGREVAGDGFHGPAAEADNEGGEGERRHIPVYGPVGGIASVPIGRA